MARQSSAPKYWANAFWYPKVADHEHEWEDACRFDGAHGMFAIADGASTTYRAREWARLLVDAYVEQPPETRNPRQSPHQPGEAAAGAIEVSAAWFARRARDWEQKIEAEVATTADTDNWWDQALDTDAGAAFLGVRLFSTAQGLTYCALALGDCCLFHLRDRTLLGTFPLTAAEQFTHRAVLAVSRWDGVRTSHIRFQPQRSLAPGDVLVLASDALAKALMEQGSHGDGVWDAVRSVDNEAFRAMVVAMRDQQAIEVDDVTMLRITFMADHDAGPNDRSPAGG